MNEQLKFSWGHIIAFLALIVLSYITFVGVTYRTDGDFTKAFITMVGINVVLFVFFIGAQMMKATTKKFARRIWIERFLIFSSPVVFVLCMLPFYHFGSVQSQNDEIVGHFTDAITASKKMFSDYDSYSKQRIESYEHMLDRVINNQSIQPKNFTSCGFTKDNVQIQKKNMLKALRLQLISENYDSLKAEATKWIESSSKGASTWNVFLLGNTKEIKNAIHTWNTQLADFSSHKMNNEEFKGYNQVKTFSEVSGSLVSVDAGLDGLTKKFSDTAFPPLSFILGSIVLYLALLFPYFLQDRHTKNLQCLLRKRKGTSCSSNMIIETSIPKKKKGKEVETDTYTYEDINKPLPSAPEDNDDDYASFTM